MDFDSLTLFLAVAEHGSFTRAAIQRGMTQPTISKRIQLLEVELGAVLFYRHGRGVRPTDAGLRLAEVARSLFAQLSAVKEELADAGQQLRGSVTLGLPPSLGASLSVPLARRFQQQFPLAKLRIIQAFSGSLLELLDVGKMDLAVLYDARLSPTMLVTPLLRETLYLIERVGDKGQDKPAAIAELGSGPFVLSNSSNGLRRVIDAAASLANLQIEVSVEIDSLTALKRMVELGPERCVLPYGAVYREVREGKLHARPFEGRGLVALLVSATPLHRPIGRLTKELQALLVAEVEHCVREGMLTGVPL